MAAWRRQGTGDVILHSDRGGRFNGGVYQNFLTRNAVIGSMSAVGHCGDNATCEGSFGLLKRERPYRHRYHPCDEVRADVLISSSGSTTLACSVGPPGKIRSS